MSNCIIIPAYNHFKDEFKHNIESWQSYGKLHNIDVIIHDKKVPSVGENSDWELSIWERWKDLEPLLDKYDNFLQVDCDTMIRWDAPNLFSLYNPEADISGVLDGRAGYYHFPQWKSLGEFSPNLDLYFNAGCLRFSKKFALYVLNNLSYYYDFWNQRYNNQVKIDAVDQTAINIMIQKAEMPIEVLPLPFNNLVLNNYHDFSFINENYVWHFTGPNMGGWSNKTNLIAELWSHIKQYYK